MDLRFDPTATRARYPEQSLTPLSDVLARRAR
jgi:hypothetical protein